VRLTSGHGDALDGQLALHPANAGNLLRDVGELRPLGRPRERRHVAVAVDERRHLLGCEGEQAQARVRPARAVDVGVIALLLAPLVLLSRFVGAGEGNLAPAGRPGEILDGLLVLVRRRGQCSRFPAVGGDEVERIRPTFRAVGEESDVRAIRRPARTMVVSRPGGKLARRTGSIGWRNPQGHGGVLLALPARRERIGHLPPVRRQLEVPRPRHVGNHLSTELGHSCVPLG
jgi:hypothetical protein